MARITIDELLDSVPMGGCIVVYAPMTKVTERAHIRNLEMRGEWFDVHGIVDRSNRLAVVITRKEVWNIANAQVLLQEQHRWQRMDNVWRT